MLITNQGSYSPKQPISCKNLTTKLFFLSFVSLLIFVFLIHYCCLSAPVIGFLPRCTPLSLSLIYLSPSSCADDLASDFFSSVMQQRTWTGDYSASHIDSAASAQRCALNQNSLLLWRHHCRAPPFHEVLISCLIFLSLFCLLLQAKTFTVLGIQISLLF